MVTSRGMVCLAELVCFAGALAMIPLNTASAQDVNTPPPPVQSPPVFRGEKRLVLVDAVVTDKKGNYVRDLTVKDFRVWEDKKEQSIESFSSETDPASPLNGLNHYLVLFFDNSSMDFGDQMRARQAALKFIDSNSGPKHLMAIVNFGGSLQVAQNFTDSKQRLEQVVNGVKFSSVSPNAEVASAGMPSLGGAEAGFGARDVLLAVRTLAKGLSSVPGRKTVVFLSSGFPLDDELRSELTAVIDVCNKANVAIYPIDIRGLVAAMLLPPRDRFAPQPAAFHSSVSEPSSSGAVLEFASYIRPLGFVAQRGAPSGSGGRSGGGMGSGMGGRSGGNIPPGPVGGRGPGSGGYNAASRGMSNGGLFGNPSRSLIPPMPSVLKNQEVLYALATGTGGFMIVNTNDLLGGLEKIAKEQNEYYVLGYTPLESKEGSCHELKVKVERGGSNVRARSGYCDTKPQDLLAGTAVEKNLELRAAAAAAGNVNASMQAPFFYTSANTARVDVAMEIAPTGLQFQKQKGKLHSEMNVLGIASESDGAVAARFSDTVKFDFENKKALEDFQNHLVHYETQFDVGSGKYDLKVVFTSGGASFGKVQSSLAIDAYDPKKFGISGVAFSKDIHRMADLDLNLEAALLEDRKPLVSQGMELVPTGSTVFKKTDRAAVYLEVYEPLLLEAKPPLVGVELRIVDRKTGQQKLDTGFVNVLSYSHAGNPVIPVGLRMPFEKLEAGFYTVELRAKDDAGNVSVLRSLEFVVD